jgi:hypothetical protein
MDAVKGNGAAGMTEACLVKTIATDQLIRWMFSRRTRQGGHVLISPFINLIRRSEIAPNSHRLVWAKHKIAGLNDLRLVTVICG